MSQNIFETPSTLREELISKFTAHYGQAPAVISYAPGRIEVLGNHTDYNEGYVFSAAINYGTYFAIAPDQSGNGHQHRVVAGDLMHEVAFDRLDPKPVKEDTWANYVIGTTVGITAKCAAADGLPAFNAMFLGNIPLGSGLSSSAALEMCTAKAICRLNGITSLDNLSLAKIGQAAEKNYAGCNCGLLDQLSSLCGAENKLVRTDFRTFDIAHVDIPDDVCFLMCNTHAKHALVDGEYDSRRKACEEAAAFFAKTLSHPVAALRDVTMAELEQYKSQMDPVTANRAAHPIGEDERVLKGAECLNSGDLAAFGQLLFDSHDSSRHLFQNSCEELDVVVDAAKKIPGVLGARLSGGGFGGSVVVLVAKRDAETAAAALAAAYAHKYGKPCDVSKIQPSQGATVNC